MAEDLSAHLTRLHAPGLVDMHYDLLMDLYEKRDKAEVLTRDYLTDFQTGGLGVLGAAIFIPDKYLPEQALRVALGQVARLYIEVARTEAFAICRTFAEIQAARQANKIAFLITMEGVEPLGTDLNLLRAFYELGVRMIGLTHARRNMAGDGGVFAPSGSSPQGLTRFGRTVVQTCEQLGIILDLAHINPAGFDDIVALTRKPVVISHTNARRYYDIERNVTDAQIRQVGARGGVIGVNAVLVSPHAETTHLDRYIDHIEHIAGLIGIDGVGIGFDFFEAIFKALPPTEQAQIAALADVHFIPNLTTHAHARFLTERLLERGFSDDAIEKILYRNWMRIFKECL